SLHILPHIASPFRVTSPLDTSRSPPQPIRGASLRQELHLRQSQLDLVAVSEPHAANRAARHRYRAALPRDPRAVRAPVAEEPEAVAREVLDVGVGARHGGGDGIFAVQE